MKIDFCLSKRYIISMKTYKRIIAILFFLTGFSVLSFGETFYGFSNGLYRSSDIYFEEDFGREQNGLSTDFFFYYFPGKSFIGVFAQTSIGTLYSGYEWNDDDMVSQDIETAWNGRLFIAPSFKIQLGQKIRFPISVGPVFSIYREESWSTRNSGKKGFYEALSMGVMADAAMVFNPSRWFFLKHGVSVSWDFLRLERGEMMSEYRDTRSNRFQGVQYSAVLAAIYIGVGIRFAQ